MQKSGMATLRLLVMLTFLPVALFALSACSPGSSPEGVVRAYIDAINARDKSKFVSLWSPDRHNDAADNYDRLVALPLKIDAVTTVVVREDPLNGGKLVTVQAHDSQRQLDVGFTFWVEQLNGTWFIWRVLP